MSEKSPPKGIQLVRGTITLAVLGGVLSVLAFTDIQLCPTKLLVGVPCPGCGLSRASVALFDLDFASAATLHPLVFLVLPVVTYALGRLVLTSYGFVPPSWDPLRRLPSWPWAILVVLLLGVWGARLSGYLGGPSDPVTPREGALVQPFFPPG